MKPNAIHRLLIGISRAMTPHTVAMNSRRMPRDQPQQTLGLDGVYVYTVQVYIQDVPLRLVRTPYQSVGDVQRSQPPMTSHIMKHHVLLELGTRISSFAT